MSGGARLIDHCYGKSRVRVLKVLREGTTHTIKELTVAVRLTGDFERSYTVAAGDNSQVVATDTMKNTVNVLAARHLGVETEPFLVRLAEHFTTAYPQVATATVEATERSWQRLGPHSFTGNDRSEAWARVTASGEESAVVESGVRDLVILKSSGSGFSGFPRDAFTTLPETEDRLFATALSATWRWKAAPASYAAANRVVMEAMLRPFSTEHSPSVQATMFQMGEAALGAVGEIAQIHLVMPNQHCLLVNLAPFGVANANELFVPTDEPHGLIEATVGRGA